MEFKELTIKGSFEVTLKPLSDDRGFFMRTFDDKIFETMGLSKKWVQENHSRSEQKGIIRGLHFQLPPFSETKMVRCIKGEILDVFVDIRNGSETFGKWDSVILSEDNKKMVLIPRGFAHGFCTLSDVSEVVYKVDNYYAPGHDRGIAFDDVKLAINWQLALEELQLSDKDKTNPDFSDTLDLFE